MDQAFYDRVKQDNGGKLPPDLVGADGKPRKLTMSPSDRAYREEWKATAAKARNSKAVLGKGIKSSCVPCASKAVGATIPPIILPGKGGKKIKVGPNPQPPAPETPPASASARAAKQKAAKEAAATEPCKHSTLVVECSHSEDRKFKLELPSKSDPEAAITQFEVIDDGKEKITCTTELLAGPCGSIHANKVFDVYPADSITTNTNSKLVFRANHDPKLQMYSFAELFSPGKARDPQTFSIRTQTCQQERELTATVLVYPQLDWDVDVSLSLGSTGSVKDEVDEDTDKRTPTEDRSSEFEFSGKVAVTVNGTRREFAADIKHDLNQALNILTLACKTAEFLWSVGNDLGGIEIEFKFPSPSFKGTWGWREIEASPHCGYGCDITAGFTPLLGASVKLDILSFLITKFPGVGQVIERLRKKMEKYAAVEVFFEVSGDVNGTFHYLKIASDAVGDASGNLAGTLEFTLEGLVKAEEYKFLCFHAGGEVKVGGKATFEASLAAGADEKGAYGKGSLEFSGLVIYAVVAVDGGITWGPPPDDDASSDTENDPATVGGSLSQSKGDLSGEADVDKSGLSGNVVYQHEWTLIEKRQLLGSDDKHYFLSGEQGG